MVSLCVYTVNLEGLAKRGLTPSRMPCYVFFHAGRRLNSSTATPNQTKKTNKVSECTQKKRVTKRGKITELGKRVGQKVNTSRHASLAADTECPNPSTRPF